MHRASFRLPRSSAARPHAGSLSDVFVRRAKKANKGAGLVGVRVRVVLVYAILTALALLAFSVCPNVPAVQWASIALIGFGLYGPQMLIGLCGAEVRTPVRSRFALGLQPHGDVALDLERLPTDSCRIRSACPLACPPCQLPATSLTRIRSHARTGRHER